MSESEKTVFQCNNCSREFARQASLTKHVRSKTCTRGRVCPRCDVEFADQYSLKRHLARKFKCLPTIAQNDCMCPGCGNEYADRSGMLRHFRARCQNRTSVEEELNNLDLSQSAEDESTSSAEDVEADAVSTQKSKKLTVFGGEDLLDLDVCEVYDAMTDGLDAVLVNFLDLVLVLDTIRYDTERECIMIRCDADSWEDSTLDEILDVITDEVREYIMNYQPNLAEVALKHGEIEDFCKTIPHLLNGPDVYEPCTEERDRAMSLIRAHPI